MNNPYPYLLFKEPDKNEHNRATQDPLFGRKQSGGQLHCRYYTYNYTISNKTLFIIRYSSPAYVALRIHYSNNNNNFVNMTYLQEWEWQYDETGAAILNHILSLLSPPSEATLERALDLGLFGTIGYLER